MNTLLLVHPPRCSKMLLTAGALPALIHAVDVSPAPKVQEAAACTLQNLASTSDAIRADIVAAGGVRPVVKMLRRPDVTHAVATSACGALQNLALLPENEEAIIEGGGIQVLLHHCSKGVRTDYDERDRPVVEAATLALMNIAAGGEAACRAIGEQDGIPVLAGLLHLHSRHNPKTGVLETPTPTLRLIHAAGATLRGIAMLPDMQGQLRAAKLIKNVSLVLERLLTEQIWIPSILEGLQAEALEALLAFLRNICRQDSGVTTRSLCVNTDLGVHLGKLLVKLIPTQLPPAAAAPASGSAVPLTPSAQPPQPSPVTAAAAAVLLEGLAAARNLSAGLPAMQHQLGMTGLVESVVALLNLSPQSPWASTQHVTQALHSLANLTDASEENRHRAVAAACVRQVMTYAGNSSSKQVQGAASLALQNLAQSPEARLKVLERDGLKLLYTILDRAATNETIAGAAGALVHVGRSGKVHLHKFVQLGGTKVLTRVAQDCNNNAALHQLLNLVLVLALQSELKIRLIEDGVMRVTLQAQILKSAVWSAVVGEMCLGTDF